MTAAVQDSKHQDYELPADLAALVGNLARNHLELIAIWREHGILSDQTTCDTALRIIDRLVGLSGELFGNVADLLAAGERGAA